MKPETSQSLVLTLLAAGLVTVQFLIGGARMVYLLPACLLIAAAGVMVSQLYRSVQVRPDRFCLISTGALAAYILGRAVFSPVEYLARPDLLTALAGLTFYLVSTLFLSGTTQRFTMTLVLVLVGIVHVSLEIVQFKAQSNFMLLPWIYRPDFGFRGSGLFISPNHLSAVLGMLGVLTLSICCWSRVGLGTRAFAFYGFMVCLTGIALTGSRAGYVSTAAGLGLFAALSIFLAQRFNRPNFFGLAMATAFILTAVVAATLYFVVNGEVYENRLRHVPDPSRQAVQLRPAAIAQYRLNPVWGTGSGTLLFHARQFRSPAVQNDPEHVHHEFLELLAEYGWVGVGLFSLFVLTHLRSAITGISAVLGQKLAPTAWTASNELALITGAVCALAVGFVHASRDFTFHLPANALLAAFLFSILANPTVETAGRRERRPLPPWVAWLAPGVALLLLLVTLPRLWPEVLAERARLALRDRQYPAALDRARRALRGDPANPHAAYYAGEALRYLALEADAGPPASALRREAVTAFESGLRAFPQDVRLLLKLGQVFDDLGETPRAAECLARALAAAPQSGTVLACVGLHWHRQWQLERAGLFYRRAQTLGEKLLSTPGLADLARDEVTLRTRDAFADLRPASPAATAAPPR